MYIGSNRHTPLAQRDEIVRPNPSIVEVVNASVVMKKTRHQIYNPRKYKLVEQKKYSEEFRISELGRCQKMGAPAPFQMILK